MTALYEGTLHEASAHRRESASGRVYAMLKREILTCQIPPGAHLYEGQLAERLHVSKTPIRDALAMLVHEGFVELSRFCYSAFASFAWKETSSLAYAAARPCR